MTKQQHEEKNNHHDDDFCCNEELIEDNAATRKMMHLFNKNLVKLISMLEEQKISQWERGY